MKILFTVCMLLTSAAVAKTDFKWSYKSFPISKASQVKSWKMSNLKTEHLNLLPVKKNGGGTSLLWGVEQVFVSKNLKQRVFVKQNLELSGDKSTAFGGWLKIAKGHLLHIKDQKFVWAIYAEGFSAAEQSEIEKAAKANILKREQAIRSSLWINVAEASEVAPAMPPQAKPYATARPSSSASSENNLDWNSLVTCGGEVLSSAWDTTGGMVIGAAEGFYEAVTDPEAVYNKDCSFEGDIRESVLAESNCRQDRLWCCRIGNLFGKVIINDKDSVTE